MKKYIGILIAAIFISSFAVPVFSEPWDYDYDGGYDSYDDYYDDNSYSDYYGGGYSEKPYWYPADVNNFRNFHGENLPGVVDDADILTPEQEAELSEQVKRIADTYGFGYVIFTDNSTYGLSKEVYSADFLYFNGYGRGDNYNAVCFFLSLEEGNRGWRTTSINDCESIFTSGVCYEIDEIVDSDMRSGNYYEAFKNQADYIEKLCYDLVNPPEWYPEGTNLLTVSRDDRQNTNAVDLSKERVVDNGNVFSEDERAELTGIINGIIDKYGYDVVIFTDTTLHQLYLTDYSSDFYYYNGYGKDGVLLTIIKKGGGYELDQTYFGNCRDLSSCNLENRMADDLYGNGFFGASKNYLKNLKFVFKHKRLPMDSAEKKIYFAISSIVGLISAFFTNSGRKRKMQLNPSDNAAEYVVPGSFKITGRNENYLYTTVTKTPIPRETRSGSSGGGGSSFSGGGVSSGGGSFSSGGRDF